MTGPRRSISRSCSRPSRPRRPVDAADVLARRLAEALGATEVSFLIADFSGNALVRLEHAGGADATRTRGRETAERVAIADTPQGRTLTGQRVEVENGPDGVRVFAPVTNRGEAIGVLELALPAVPDEQTVADLGRAAHALAYVVIANRRFTDLFAWGQRSVPLSLAAEIQHRLLPGCLHLRGGPVHAVGLAGARRRRGRRHVRLHPRPRPAAPVDDRRHGPRRGVGDPRDRPGGRAAQRAAGGRHARPAGPHRQRRALRLHRRRQLRHRAARADRPAHRDRDRRQRRPPAAAAPARRRRRGDRAGGRPAVRHRPRARLPHPGPGLRARRPRAVLHRRHHRRRARRGGHGDPPARDRAPASRARPSRSSSAPSAPRATVRCATTPRPCASTGTAAGRSRAPATAAPTRPPPRPPSRSASSACSGSPGAT